MTLKDIKLREYRALVEGTGYLQPVKMELVDLRMLSGEEADSHLQVISRKYLGTRLEAIKRHTNCAKSAAVAGIVCSPPGVGWKGPSARDLTPLSMHNPTRTSSKAPCPPGHLP